MNSPETYQLNLWGFQFEIKQEHENLYIFKNIQLKKYVKLNNYDYNLVSEYSKEISPLPSEEHSRLKDLLTKVKPKSQKSLTISGVNSFISKVSKYVPVFFYSHWFIFISLGMGVLSTTLTLGVKSQTNHLIFFVWTLINIVAHELSHGLVLYKYKRYVGKVGVKFYLFLPAFFVDTSDAIMCTQKQRVHVSLIGPIVNLFLNGILLGVITIFKLDLTLFSKYILIINFFALINLLPIKGLDGYFALSDWLGIYNFDNRAKNYVKKDLFKDILRWNCSGRKLIFTFYWVFNLAVRICIYFIILRIIVRLFQ